MRRLLTRTKVALVFLALAVVLSGLFLVYQYFFSAKSISSKEIGNGVTVTGSNLPGSLQATLSKIQAPYSPRLATVVSPTYQIVPSGALGSSITIQLPLTHAVPSGSRLIVMTADSPGGPWTPLMANLSQDGKSVSVSVDHLSFFDALWLDLSAMLNDFKAMFLDAFIPDSFQSAKPPSCQNESQARQDNYSISSKASRHVLYWCFGIENGKRVLKAVNNRAFPISIQHSGLTVANVSQPPFLLNIEQLDASLRQEVLLLPGGEADFTAELGTGKQGSVHTQWDAGAEMIIGFQTAVETLSTIFSLFGYEKPVTLEKIESVLDRGDCASVLRDAIATLHPNLGKFFTTCLKLVHLEEIYGEGWANLYDFVLTAGHIIDYLVGSAFGLIDSLLMRDQYEVVITHSAPSACPPGAGVCLGTRMGDVAGDGTDQIGMTYTKGSCSSFGCTFSNLTIHVVLANGSKIDYAVPPYPYPTPIPLTNPQFLGVTNMEGNGRVVIVITFSGCADGCDYYAYEYLNGQLQPMPFYGSPQGGDGLSQAVKCSVVNGAYQVTTTYEFQVPGESHPAITYQADGKGGMRYVSQQNVTQQQAGQDGIVGANCPGLSS